MSNFPVVRAKSILCLPREREVEREGAIGTLSRVTSVPNLSSLHVGQFYRPGTLHKYRRDWDSLDDHNTDRYTNNPSLYWQDYRYAARRYINTDPVTTAIPHSLGLDYPSFWTRYKWYKDYLSPQYWRKYRDPYYDRPLWDTWKPYFMDRMNTKRAVKMYRQGLIDFKFLDQNWITPNALQRREKDWSDVYTPCGRYGPRRYFYSFAA